MTSEASVFIGPEFTVLYGQLSSPLTYLGQLYSDHGHQSLYCYLKKMVADVVIVAAKRTPIGSFQGCFSTVPAHQLASAVIKVKICYALDYLIIFLSSCSGCSGQHQGVSW